jgi:hypothetical protein
MALGIALAVAKGNSYLSDIPCDRGDVLYLALEDSQSRLQARLNKLVPDGSPWPSSLQVATEWQCIDAGGIENLEGWIGRSKKPRLIIIDVLTYIRPTRPEGKNQYQADYSFLKKLQELASRTSVGILLIHHNRKAASEVDPFERVSGTFGLTGAADTTLILDRDGQGISLYGRGRDIAEFQRAVRLDTESLRWLNIGNASDVFRSVERRGIIDLLSNAPVGLRPDDIAEKMSAKRNNVDQLLSKMVKEGTVQKLARGLYSVPGILTGVTECR